MSQGSSYDTADTNPLSQRPRWTHDCDRCVFLGQQGAEDVYFCTQGGTIPTVIFRYGDEGVEYRSGWHLRGELDTPLLVKAERAAAR